MIYAIMIIQNNMLVDFCFNRSFDIGYSFMGILNFTAFGGARKYFLKRGRGGD